jgi:hypothetical protein
VVRCAKIMTHNADEKVLSTEFQGDFLSYSMEVLVTYVNYARKSQLGRLARARL